MQAVLWLRVAAYLTWAVSGVPGFLMVTSGRLAGTPAIAWTVAFALFGVAFTLCDREVGVSRWRSVGVLYVAAQTAAGLVVVWTTRDALPAALLVIVAAVVPDVFGTRGAILWVFGQSLALGAVFWSMDGPFTALVAGGAFAGFQLFAVSTTWFAHSERLAREELARTNAELTATRELLAENSRIAERLRIARDLHDTLGHHLTALSLQLDVASRMTDGAVAEHVSEAHAIAKLLLSDVRDVVGAMRGSGQIDLSQALRSLAAAAEPMAHGRGRSLQIHLEMPDRLVLDDAAQAHALMRCVQEIITNTARHASAANLWIRIAQRADGIDLHARDDGRGAPAFQWGNGLRGMRERFEEFAGRVEFQSRVGHGFEVRGFMPRPEAVA